jgi:membrane-associated protease RseP (regulator of RpoE activity)
MTFGAEEWGLLGSSHFQDHPLLRLPAAGGGDARPLRAVAMINMDMVGRLRDDRLIASGLATSPAWRDLLEAVRAAGHVDLTVAGDSDKELVGSSDHISFYQLGVPVVFFFTGNHRQYHTPDDDLYGPIEGNGAAARLINVAGLSRVLGYIGDVAVAIANREQALPLEPDIDLMPRMSFRVVLRLLPDYGADVDGMRVAGVTPGGPAERAGIREGDVIVRFGVIPVHSVRDYMVGLEKAEPGKAVELELLRGEERRVLEVVPAGAGK